MESDKKEVFHKFPHLEPKTIYKFTDEYGFCYIYFLLNSEKKSPVFVIGPYFTTPPDASQLLSLGEKLGVSPSKQKYLEEIALTIPVIELTNTIYLVLDALFERLFETKQFSVVDINEIQKATVSPINTPMQDDDHTDISINIKTMERRYEFENQLIRAVTLGQIHKSKSLLSAFSDKVFEIRTPDRLRNMKNYAIIMNTLLRKAVENGGVHPFYIDKVSSDFAVKIEQVKNPNETTDLMLEMFNSYCRLVINHSLKNYSPIVKNTIILINFDLSADLTTKALAQSQSVSLGYLSAVFRKETGKTVSQFVREKRVEYAKHLLETTALQVQTISLHCGIMDAQYFSKIFKNETGKTPAQYRENFNLNGN